MDEPDFTRLAVVGLGLIGGSLALALGRSGAAGEVVGWDTDPDALAVAVARGCIDRAAASLPDALQGADLIVLAAPPQALATMASVVAVAAAPGAVVTDTASTKGQLVGLYEAALAGRAHFVGGHPMAGSERSSLAAARADLFEGMPYVLTPTGQTDALALARIEALVRRVGATPIKVSPAEHDRQVAAISHLPQLTVWALVRAALDDGEPGAETDGSPIGLAGSGWRDTVRLAGSPAALWREVCLSNSMQVDHYLARLAAEIAHLRHLLAAADARGLETYFEGSRCLAGHGVLNKHEAS